MPQSKSASFQERLVPRAPRSKSDCDSGAAMRTGAELRLESVSKSFGSVQALQPTSLSIEGGSLVALLGPSGCGKTTTLRIIAGFEAPDSGAVCVDGQDITRQPPNRRGLGMVFQNYSLFPHMTIAENIGFGLEMAGVSAAQRSTDVARMLDLVRLPEIGGRYPKQLSGGQQQRVALARAIVTNPSVLLLDEPLGALDKNLRESMQFELRQLQQRLGITTLLVTHDQEEALTMSDKVVVMDHGRAVQIGSPDEIYERPRTRFVSDFLGTSNIIEATIVGSPSNGLCRATIAGGHAVDLAVANDSIPANGELLTVAIRPEKAWLSRTADRGVNSLSGTVTDHVFRGSYHAFQVMVPGLEAPMIVYQQAHDVDGEVYESGEPIAVSWKPENGVTLEEDTA